MTEADFEATVAAMSEEIREQFFGQQARRPAVQAAVLRTMSAEDRVGDLENVADGTRVEILFAMSAEELETFMIGLSVETAVAGLSVVMHELEGGDVAWVGML